MLEYNIKAESKTGGEAFVKVRQSSINFDATAENTVLLPNPAELLLSAFAACVLKNVERYSKKLHLPYKKARISVHGIRNDNPPYIKEINYVLEIDSDVPDKKLNMWHKNIVKFGTITNTMLRAAEVKGQIKKICDENRK